jgi:hypothetical protein
MGRHFTAVTWNAHTSAVRSSATRGSQKTSAANRGGYARDKKLEQLSLAKSLVSDKSSQRLALLTDRDNWI